VKAVAVEDGLILFVGFAWPFYVTASLMMLSHAPVRWSRWAPGFLAQLPPAFEMLFVSTGFAVAVLAYCPDDSGYARCLVFSTLMPLLIVAFALFATPILKSSSELRTPTALVLLTAAFYLRAHRVIHRLRPQSRGRVSVGPRPLTHAGASQ
jgi:ABC-type transport system involved in cytochrome c biogenesis permease subunit